MSKQRHLCEFCRGWTSTPNGRKVSLDQAVATHLETCPGVLRVPAGRKAAKVVAEPEEPVTPRKRVIPRQVLND